MARVATVRARCISRATSIPFDPATDKGEHMAAYVEQSMKDEGWSEGNAKNSYRWCVKNGHFKGNVISARKPKATPEKPATTTETITVEDVAMLAAEELTEEITSEDDLEALIEADKTQQPVT